MRSSPKLEMLVFPKQWYLIVVPSSLICEISSGLEMSTGEKR